MIPKDTPSSVTRREPVSEKDHARTGGHDPEKRRARFGEAGPDSRRQLFLLFGLWPAGVLPDENGEGVAPPFLRFLSAFGFFFSLLLRI